MELGLPSVRRLVFKRVAPLVLRYLSRLVGLVSFVTFSEIERIRHDFTERARDRVREIDLRGNTFEICVEAFVHHLQSCPQLNHDDARTVAHHIRARYPELHTMALAERVTAAQKARFEARMRHQGRRDYQIHPLPDYVI